MRQFFFFLCLFTTSFLSAQSKTPGLYANPTESSTQKAKQADCYVRRFDAGTSAARRGDYRAALRLFEEAKTCPEAISSSRRMKDLESKIEFCNTQLGRHVAAASEKTNASRGTGNVEISGRKFYISPAFAKNTNPNCFQMTVAEADRAFRDSCWDDAAKLYRAAKNCADANQLLREQMSTKIESCRAAAEDELLQKEQKAIRTARHAIAANRADDAMDLLRQNDRSLAWRLADFANYYIAPDDNPDCLEAMYAAYYYEPSPGMPRDLMPVFCYQLSEDLKGYVQFKFTKSKFGDRLTALISQEKRIISWELPAMKIVEDFKYDLPNDPLGFDISPDGSLLFWGYQFFYLPNGQLLELQSVSNYCFSEDGTYFFYEDVSTGQVLAVNLNNIARIQQQRNSSNVGRLALQPATIQVSTGLLGMAYRNEELWFGYNDRVEVYGRDKKNKTMALRMTWQFADSTLSSAEVTHMKIYPETREAIVSTVNQTYYFFLNLPPNEGTFELVGASHKSAGELMAFTSSANPLLTVNLQRIDTAFVETLSINAPANNFTGHRFINKTLFSSATSAAISDNGNWLACQDGYGKTLLWLVKDTAANPPFVVADAYPSRLSPDGNHLFASGGSKLRVFDVDASQAGAQHEFPITGELSPPVGSSNKWAVFFRNQSTLSIQNLTTKQNLLCDIEVRATKNPVPYSFDSQEERYFAYSPGNGLVVVKSLTDESTIDSRNFGGIVTLIKSIPGSDKLLIVTKTTDAIGYRSTTKLWDFSKRGENPQVVRLQDYNVNNAIVSDQGNRLAVSNGEDIRIFSLENLDNESVVIKAARNDNPHNIDFMQDVAGEYINYLHIAFRPDGLALVSGDNFGNVAIWDVTTGQPILRFANVWDGIKHPVYDVAFAYEGTRLRLLSYDRLFTVELDAYALRNVVQSVDRSLISFSPSQIRDYNLEIAFKYPGNFDRLAQSGDFPLIRSFFQYFREQSFNSNNIEQVRTYCERAFTLYELLDENGQGNLESTMIEMYEDYIIKQLLRNNPAEASRVVMHLERRFNRPTTAILAAAHTSMMRHDLTAASRLYTDYLLLMTNKGAFYYTLDDINTKLSQFQEYDLLDAVQITCLCEVFQQFNRFPTLCPSEKKFTTPAYSAQILVYQQIYHDIDSVAYWSAKYEKLEVLESAYALASKLEYPNNVVDKHPFDVVALDLAKNYLELAEFEQKSPKTPLFYEKAVALVSGKSPLRPEIDTARLNLLTSAHMLWAAYLLESDKPVEATSHINAGIQAAKKLGTYFKPDTPGEQAVASEKLSPLYFDLCLAKLLEGKPGEARKAFEMATEPLSQRSPTTLLGLAALLENNDIDAFLNFGSITTAAELGETLSRINRLGDLLPAQHSHLAAFAPRLKEAFLSGHPVYTQAEVDYWHATFQMNRFAAQGKIDSALYWSNVATNNMEKISAVPENAVPWRNFWFAQRINQAYFMLNARHRDTSTLSEIIRFSDETLARIAAEDPYTAYRTYTNTNLAHAYFLRNQPGDRQKAVDVYKEILSSYNTVDDTWELLQKDFRDLFRAGVQWPDLKNMIQTIKPEGIKITPEEWREMGE